MAGKGVEIPIELSLNDVVVEGRTLKDIEIEADKVGRAFADAMQTATKLSGEPELLHDVTVAMQELNNAYEDYFIVAREAQDTFKSDDLMTQALFVKLVADEYAAYTEKFEHFTDIFQVLYSKMQGADFVPNPENINNVVGGYDTAANTFYTVYNELVAADVNMEKIRKHIVEFSTALRDMDIEKLRELLGTAFDLSPTLVKMAGGLQAVTNSSDNATKGAKNHRGELEKLITAYKRLHKTSFSSTSSLERNFNRLKKNVLQFVLGFRSMYFLVRRLRKTFIDSLSEMTKYVPKLNTQVSTMVTAFNRLKGSLGTAFQPIASYVIPIITTLTNALTNCMYAMGKFFATLTGQGVIYKATANQKDFARSLNKTAGAANKADKALAKFDTLNILGSKDTGGSGGASGADFGFTPEALDTEDAASELARKVKEAWQKVDFTEVGVIIGTKLNNALLMIQWPAIQLLAYNLGTDFATFLNGVLSTNLPMTLGITLRNAFNTAIKLLAGFILNLDWGAVAGAFGTGIVNFIMNVDWGLLAKTLLNLIGGLVLIVFTAITALLLSSLAKLWIAFVEWITEGWDKFIADVDTWKDDSLNKLQEWLDAVATKFDDIHTKLVDTWESIKSAMHDALEDMKGNMKSVFNTIIGHINNFVSGVVSGINAVIDALNTINVDIPDWVPLWGGQSFGVNLNHVNAPHIPELAKGAVIPPNAPFMAMLGDQKRGTNIEAPLDTIVAAFRQAQSEQPISVNINFEGSLAQLARILKPALDTENNRVGGTLVRGGIR